MLKIFAKFTNFLRQVRNELKRVKWPTIKEIRRLTLVVLVAIVTLGFYISIFDVILTKFIELGIK